MNYDPDDERSERYYDKEDARLDLAARARGASAEHNGVEDHRTGGAERANETVAATMEGGAGGAVMPAQERR